MWLGRRAGLGSHMHQMWEGLQPGMEGVCWLPSIVPWCGSPGSQPHHGSRARGGRGSAPGTEPPCAPSGYMGTERRALCAAWSFVSLSCCHCSALAASSTPQLSRIAVCCFIYLFIFSWKTGLLQGILCSFPGSCPSRDLKNSRRMRCSHPEQCCTCGWCRCRSGYYLELYWGEEVRLIRADAAISHEGSIPTALALPNGMTFECITLLLLILEETDLGEKSRIHSCLKAGSATTTLKDDPATSLATFPMTYSSSPSELSSWCLA